MTNCTSLLWFPPEGLSDRYVSDPIATPEVSTRYWVRGVTENGCYAGDSITIYVSEESLVQIPNAFAPGGSNKVFKVILEGTANVNHFRIFNRWGNLLFETKDINEGWDGTYNGTPQPFGVYIYELEAVSGTGKIIRKHGNLTLLR
jgi:gliding motility-associated-like protein